MTIAAFSLALVGIVTNAMIFQRGRHPAPLFGLGQSVDGLPDAMLQGVAMIPPPATPMAVEQTGTIALQTPAPAPPIEAAQPAAPTPAPARSAAARPHHEDGIGGLLASAKLATEAHPRPGRASAVKTAAKPNGAAVAKTDTVAKLLAGQAHHARMEHEAAASSGAGVAKSGHDHHVRADGAKTASKSE